MSTVANLQPRSLQFTAEAADTSPVDLGAGKPRWHFQPRPWILEGPCTGRQPRRGCILAFMMVLSPDTWLFPYPPLVTLPQKHIHECHTHLSVSHQQLCGFCPWARGESQEQHHCSTEPGTSSAGGDLRPHAHSRLSDIFHLCCRPVGNMSSKYSLHENGNELL